jgi:hypothetical protein
MIAHPLRGQSGYGVGGSSRLTCGGGDTIASTFCPPRHRSRNKLFLGLSVSR